MHERGYAIALALAASLAVSPAMADQADLAGIRAVRVAASQTTPDAIDCGLDLRQMLPALSDRLQAGGLAVDDHAEVTVTLSVLTAHDPATDRCMSAPMLGAYRAVSYFDEKAGWLRTGHVVLWQRGTAASSAAADHPGVARGAVTELGRELLASWSAASDALARH